MHIYIFHQVAPFLSQASNRMMLESREAIICLPATGIYILYDCIYETHGVYQ